MIKKKWLFSILTPIQLILTFSDFFWQISFLIEIFWTKSVVCLWYFASTIVIDHVKNLKCSSLLTAYIMIKRVDFSIKYYRGDLLLTLWASMRLLTVSISPWTGCSSDKPGSALESQSKRAWRASLNWPENNRDSSKFLCLKNKKHVQSLS